MKITPWQSFCDRRNFLKGIGLLGASNLFASAIFSPVLYSAGGYNTQFNQDEITPLKSATSYNNYYEFSTDKEAVKFLAKDFSISPWTLSIEGEVTNPITINIEQLNQFEPVNRIYSLRCVEGWSMVIPWSGIQLDSLLKFAGAKQGAKYVRFESINRPSQMFNQRRAILPWPYTEGLTIEEAMHPLTILATGMYNQSLAPQNGAPIRLVVPWKYGFKSIKAVSRIVVVNEKPETSWNRQVPSEYGFYANVNPKVSHPRWSQSREVRIGELRKRATLPFNGYKDQVAHLYSDLDLNINF